MLVDGQCMVGMRIVNPQVRLQERKILMADFRDKRNRNPQGSNCIPYALKPDWDRLRVNLDQFVFLGQTAFRRFGKRQNGDRSALAIPFKHLLDRDRRSWLQQTAFGDKTR